METDQIDAGEPVVDDETEPAVNEDGHFGEIRLADVEGVRPPGLESDPELVAQIAADVKAGRTVNSGVRMHFKFSTRQRLVDGWTRRDALLALDPDYVLSPDEYEIDGLAVDDASELARAVYWALSQRNLPNLRQQRMRWAALLRSEKGMSLRAIAKLIGVSHVAVGAWLADPIVASDEPVEILGQDGKSYTAPPTRAPAKKAAAKAEPRRWTPPFTPEDDDPACPECSAYGQDPCENLDTGAELKRWHPERVDDVVRYRAIRSTMTLVPAAVAEDDDLPECPTCGASGPCRDSGFEFEFEAHCHPQRLEAWARVREVRVLAAAEAERQPPSHPMGRVLHERDRLLYEHGPDFFLEAVEGPALAEQMRTVVDAIVEYWSDVRQRLIAATTTEPISSSQRYGAIRGVACPQCGADVYQSCHTPSGGTVPGEGFHARRIKAAGLVVQP